jgi:prevent-host-death family protein
MLPTVSTNELRDSLSLWINRAAFGSDPILVTRRGRKIAAIISIWDTGLLENARLQRDEEMRKWGGA